MSKFKVHLVSDRLTSIMETSIHWGSQLPLFCAYLDFHSDRFQSPPSPSDQTTAQSRTTLGSHHLVAFVGQGMFSKSRLLRLTQMTMFLVLSDVGVHTTVFSTDIYHTTWARYSVHSTRGQWILGILNWLQPLLDLLCQQVKQLTRRCSCNLLIQSVILLTLLNYILYDSVVVIDQLWDNNCHWSTA